MASSPACAVGDKAPVALPADLPVHLSSSLTAALAAVPDARRRRGRRHELTGVLTIAACACLTGASSYVAISEWAAARVLRCSSVGASRRMTLSCRVR